MTAMTQAIISTLASDLVRHGATVEVSDTDFLCAALGGRMLSVDIFDDGHGELVAQLIAGDGPDIEPTDDVELVEVGAGLSFDALTLLSGVTS